MDFSFDGRSMYDDPVSGLYSAMFKTLAEYETDSNPTRSRPNHKGERNRTVEHESRKTIGVHQSLEKLIQQVMFVYVNCCRVGEYMSLLQSFEVSISFTNNSMYRTRCLPNDPTSCRHPLVLSVWLVQCLSPTECSAALKRSMAQRT